VLKITITETAADRRWIVQGRLVGPWVSELRTTWKNAHRGEDRRACIFDLNDVTFIDKSGERLLRAMCKKGAQLIGKGLYVNHVLEQLKAGAKGGLVTLMVCLFVGLQTNVIVPATRGQTLPARLEMKAKQFECEQKMKSGMPADLMDSIGEANAVSSSADRMARTEEQ
jgi:anti-anti-sigma regulatory factor